MRTRLQEARFWTLASVITLGLGLLFFKSVTAAHEQKVSYDTYLSVMLTALGVVLAALALFVGAAAIWGYQQISTFAEQRAEVAVERRLAALLQESNIRETIATRIRAEADEMYSDLQITRTEAPNGEDKAVAEDYPEL